MIYIAVYVNENSQSLENCVANFYDGLQILYLFVDGASFLPQATIRHFG